MRSEAKAGGFQGTGMFSFPAHHCQAAATARLTMYPSYTHTPPVQTPLATRTPQTQEQAPHAHKKHMHKQTIQMIWSVHTCWHEPLVAGHKLWSPQRLPLKALTLPLEAGLDISPCLPNPLLPPVFCPQTYGLWLSNLWSYPPVTLDWSSLTPYTQRTERTLNQENN